MKKTNNYQAPEFQVLKQNEANAKFFVASGSRPTSSGNVVLGDGVIEDFQL